MTANIEDAPVTALVGGGWVGRGERVAFHRHQTHSLWKQPMPVPLWGPRMCSAHSGRLLFTWQCRPRQPWP